MRTRALWAALACVFALGGAPTSSAETTHDFAITVLSSPAAMVTGGDALVRVTIPRTVPLDKATVSVNGDDVTSTLERDDAARTLTGMVRGLRLGENTVFADSNGNGNGRPTATLTLVNHPVTGPIFSGPQQQPFVCKTQTQGLGFPQVDNQSGIGMRLFQTPGNPATPTDRLEQGLHRADGRRLPLPDDDRAVPAASGRPAAREHRDHDDARRPHRAVRRPPRARHDRPLHLLDRDPRPARRSGGGAGPLALEPPAHLLLRRRRRDRAQPGDARRRRHLYDPGLAKGYAVVSLERHAHGDALQPRARRRDRDHDEGAVHRGLRRPGLHRRRRRLGRRDPAVRLRAEPPARDHRRGDPAVLVPRHGHADDPRRRLRAARALHGRHRRRQPEVGDVAEPDVDRGHERAARRARIPTPAGSGTTNASTAGAA